MPVVTQALRRWYTGVSKTYSRRGFKGLCVAILTNIKIRLMPTIYRVDFLRRRYHPTLVTAWLELTNKCNLRCKMCNWRTRETTGLMSRSLYERCIDQLAEMRLPVLNLEFAGESLIHPEFIHFLEYAIQKRNEGKIGSVGWTDNGTLFDQRIADLTVSLEVDWVNFSLDGLEQVNNSIRLGSKYSLIEKNIKYLLEKRGPAKRPVVLVNMVDYGKTEEQKLDFYRAWIPFVDEIELLPSIRSDNTWENKNSLPPDVKMAPPPKFCHIPLDTIVICWDGKITACCFDTHISLDLGDASKEPIKEIWTGPKFQDFRKEVVTNTYPVSSPCHGCEFWQIAFEPKIDPILDGKTVIEFCGTYRRIRRA